MQVKKMLSSALVAGLVLTVAPSMALAIGGPSGPKVDYSVPGKIGEIVVNPYEVAPLTAIIRNGGYDLTDVSVRIVPKPGGQDLKYTVSRSNVLTYGGIPVFGLYPDYHNTVEVEYKKSIGGEKAESVKETYKIYVNPVFSDPTGLPNTKAALFSSANVVKVDKEFSDRFYFVNNFLPKSGKGTRAAWNNPMSGALEWNYHPQNFIIHT